MLLLFLGLVLLFPIMEVRKCNEFLITSGFTRQYDRRVPCTGMCSSLNIKIGKDDWYLGRCDASPSYCSSFGSQTTKVLKRNEFEQLIGKDMLKLLPEDLKDVVSTVKCCEKDYSNEPNINRNYLLPGYLIQIE